MISNPDLRYDPRDFQYLLDEAEGPPTHEGGHEAYAGDLSPVDLQTLKIPAWLKYLIHVGHDPDYQGKHASRSEAHGKATEALLKAGLDDLTIMSVLLDPRYTISERPREKGRTWLAGDIARIRAKMNGQRPTGASTPEPDASEAEPEGHHSSEINDIGSSTTKDEKPPIHLTDRGNALRLIKAHGRDLHYIYRWKKWLVWDGTRWILDEGNLIESRAKQVITQLYAEAKRAIDELSKTTDELLDIPEAERTTRKKTLDIATATLKWALKSESADRLAGLLRHARSEHGIAITYDELDANPWQLNCLNGVVDLRTGTLHPHRRQDLCTKRLDIAYDPKAICPNWDAFLWRIMGGPNADHDGHEEILLERHERAKCLVAFLQRGVGYSLTGVIREQVLFFMYGTGDNGKSTFSEVLAALIGNYYQKGPKELIMQKERGNLGAPSPEIARLFRVRLVIASEVDEQHRLNESQVKDLTGDDTLTGRGMHQDFIDFKPTHKLWMYGNHKPSIQGTDDAIWKRPKLIPFTEKIPRDEQIFDLREAKLIPELPGILAWAVRGCLAWQNDGLQVPPEVDAATQDYRREMNAVFAFIEERCQTGSNYTARVNDTYDDYLKWCESGREHTLTKRKFNAQLREQGCEMFPGTGNIQYWRGIGLMTKESS
jgi:putative DNA primase/helicase